MSECCIASDLSCWPRSAAFLTCESARWNALAAICRSPATRIACTTASTSAATRPSSATGYNWSGFGRLADPAADGTNWKQVTMISDNYFITANHNQPNRGDDPSRVRPPKCGSIAPTIPTANSGSRRLRCRGGNYVGTQVGSTDLWVGKLASTPPSWVMRYPLAKRHEATNYLVVHRQRPVHLRPGFAAQPDERARGSQ